MVTIKQLVSAVVIATGLILFSAVVAVVTVSIIPTIFYLVGVGLQ